MRGNCEADSLGILHYLPGLPPARDGGLFRYALDLAGWQVQYGDRVKLLIPGKCGAGREAGIVKIGWEGFECFRIDHALPVSEGKAARDISALYEEGSAAAYRAFLQQERPDIIHIHSFMGLHEAFLQAAEGLGIAVLFTTHDYYGLCPKATLFYKDMALCDGGWDRCAACMGQGMPTGHMAWRQSAAYRRLKSTALYRHLEYAPALRPLKCKIRGLTGREAFMEPPGDHALLKQCGGRAKEYAKLKEYYRRMFGHITYFHFNSAQAEGIYREQLGSIRGKVVHISDRDIFDRRRPHAYGQTLRIGFTAYPTPNKGFSLLEKALEEMYKEGMTDIECHVFHNCHGKKPPYMIQHPPYRADRMEKAFREFDVLVLPSLWKETFGLSALEAASLAKPVIITENVGAGEVLGDTAIMVKPGKEPLKGALVSIYKDRDILARQNEKMMRADINFDYAVHARRMYALYAECMEEAHKKRAGKHTYAAVIVTHNRQGLLKECISHVSNQTVPAEKIIVVDNASTDETAEYLKKLAEEGMLPLQVITSRENIGGAGGFGLGAQAAVQGRAEYILFIDDDAIIERNYMEEIFKARDKNPGCLAFAGRVVTDGKTDTRHRGMICRAGMKFKDCGELLYDGAPFECDIASFCGMVVDSRLAAKIGMPLKKYFIIGDDTEYSLRIRRYTKFLVAGSAILNHKTRLKQGQPSPNVRRRYGTREYYHIRNRLDYVRRHGTLADRVINGMDMFVNIVFRNLLFGLIRKDGYDWKYENDLVRRAYADAWAWRCGREQRAHMKG